MQRNIYFYGGGSSISQTEIWGGRRKNERSLGTA